MLVLAQGVNDEVTAGVDLQQELAFGHLVVGFVLGQRLVLSERLAWCVKVTIANQELWGFVL